MNNTLLLSFVPLLTISITACQNEGYPKTGENQTEIHLKSNLSIAKPASVYSYPYSRNFDEGKNVYAWADTQSGTTYFNAWKLTTGENGALSSTTPQYYSNNTEKLSIYAIQGNFEESIEENETSFPQSLTHSVIADQWTQDGDANYKKSDLVYATNEIRPTTDSQYLRFQHMLTQIEVVLKGAGKVTDEELKDPMTRVYLVNTRLNVNFSPMKTTAEETACEENRREMLAVETNDTNNPVTNILIDTRTTTDFAEMKPEGYAKAIIVPQTVGREGVPTPFIQVHLQNINNARLEYKVTNQVFKSGYKYTYHITVHEDRLDVIEIINNGSQWVEGNDSQQIESKVSQYCEGYAPDNLKPGDYYYSDGTWSDGGYRKYIDNTEDFVDVSPLEQKTLIGLVYYVGNVAKDDAALKTKLTSTSSEPEKHGLVVALKNVENGSCWLMNAQEEYFSIEGWRTQENIGYQCIEANSLSEKNQIDQTNNNLNKLLGYNNTCVLRQFNESQKATAQKMQVAAINAVDSYTPKPDDETAMPNSGWYLPSPKELSLLITGEYNQNIYFIHYYSDKSYYIDGLNPEQRTAMRTLLNRKLKTIEGAEPLYENDFPYYYSSTENETFSNFVFVIDATTGQLTGTENKVLSATPPGVRPILAF